MSKTGKFHVGKIVKLRTSSSKLPSGTVFKWMYFLLSDCDPEEACEQELGGLHGALQGEQVPECEERLRHHPLLSGDELPLRGQDDHPQGQAEHGQRLDAALKTTTPLEHGQHKKDSAFKQRRRQPERLLCQNQTLTVNIVILLPVIASFETGTLRQ